MSWEHRLAQEFKQRDNRQTPVYFTGSVLSPVRSEDDEGNVTYSGALVVSAFDGEVMLAADRLQPFLEQPQLYAGQTVALLGDVFSRIPGAQRVLILGVLSNAV